MGKEGESKRERFEGRIKGLGRAVQGGLHNLGGRGGGDASTVEESGRKSEGDGRKEKLERKVKDFGRSVHGGFHELVHGHGHRNDQGAKPKEDVPARAESDPGEAPAEQKQPPPPQIVDVVIPPFEALVRATGQKWREGDLAFVRYGTQSFAPVQKGHAGFTLRCQVEKEVNVLSVFVQSERTNMEDTIVSIEVPLTEAAARKEEEVEVDVKQWDEQVIGMVIVKINYVKDAGTQSDSFSRGHIHLSSGLGGAGVGASLGLFLGKAKEKIKKHIKKDLRKKQQKSGGGQEEEEQQEEGGEGGEGGGEDVGSEVEEVVAAVGEGAISVSEGLLGFAEFVSAIFSAS